MAASQIVTPLLVNDYFGATAGRRCEVVKEYWRNGEGWMKLVDTSTREAFDSPDVFWTQA